jgi:L-fuconolactonase
MVIDSHVHFWKYNKSDLPWIDKNMKVLQKNYLPEDIELTLKRNNVDGCIAVQAATLEVETRFLAELANTHSIIKGVVGWTDLRARDAQKKLSELKEYRAVVGVRHIVQSEPDDFLYDESFRSGISMLDDFDFTFDILIYPRQLNAAIDFVRAFPDQQFIVDHCAKPDIKGHGMDQWRKGITDLAMFPNVSCKLSGLLTEARWKEWSPGDFYPYLDIVFESFGIERVMFGSDWPVLLLSGLYVQWKSLLEKYMENFLEEDKEKVMGGNAARVYNV